MLNKILHPVLGIVELISKLTIESRWVNSSSITNAKTSAVRGYTRLSLKINSYSISCNQDKTQLVDRHLNNNQCYILNARATKYEV